jgi:hypothetical protein
MYCQHCGGKMDEQSVKFCKHCGSSIHNNSTKLSENMKGFVSVWKRIGAFVLAFFVFGIIAQIGTFLEQVIENSSVDPSSGMRDLVAVIQIGSLVGGLLIAQRVYRWIVPSTGKHKSFKLTQSSDKDS